MFGDVALNRPRGEYSGAAQEREGERGETADQEGRGMEESES